MSFAVAFVGLGLVLQAPASPAGSEPPASSAPPASLPSAGAPDDAGGRPAVLVAGGVGVQELGVVLSAGAGVGWTWPLAAVALLVRYSHLHSEHIELRPDSQRWERVRMIEGAAWVTARPGRGLFRLAFTAGVGPGWFSFNDYGGTYHRRKLAWSVAGGFGLGPFFLLLGRTEPEVTFDVPDGARFGVGGITHLSLNLTFDALDAIRSRRR